MNFQENRISDINVFEYVKFNELEELNLKYNNISDISVFGKVKLENLKSLNLSTNKIDIKLNSSLISKLKSKINDLEID